MLESNLVEILLSVVLMFNVGAYSFLWYRLRQLEDEIEAVDSKFIKVRESVSELWNRVFGHSEDQSNGGHLAQTENRFNNFEESIEKLTERIEENSERRKEEHEKVQDQLKQLIWQLSNEESVDLDKDEFDF